MANDAAKVPGSNLSSLLIDAGVKLLSPPPSVAGILSILDIAEDLLRSLAQNPSQEIRDALLPAMKGLISDKLFNHCNLEVKVSVMSCIHELVRIAAPDAPYKDECMKEIFQQTIKDVFGKFSLLSGCSYEKALQILHTVAKVRSSLILLDLDCYALISQMFQIFLDTIQPNHPNAVSSNMEEIMTRLIQESDELSLDLLKPILTVVNKEAQIISSSSRILAAKVMKNCSEKVRPYLTELEKKLRKEADACAYVLTAMLADVPPLENVVEEAGKDVSGHAPMLEGGTPSQKDSYKSSSVGKQASKPLINHGQNENLQIVGIESIQTDTLGSEGGLGAKSCGEVVAGGRKNSSKRPMRDELIEPLQMFDKESVRSDSLGAGGKELPAGGEISLKKFAGNEQIEPLQIHPKEYVKPHGLETEGLGMKAFQDVLPIGKGGKPIEGCKHFVVSDGKSSSEPRKRKNYKKQTIPRGKGTPLKKKKDNLADSGMKSKATECNAEVLPKGFKKPRDDKEYCEELIGSRVLVWWPADYQYYEGAIEAYDPVKKEHKVAYLDGDVEILRLQKEQWLLLDEISNVRHYKNPRTVKGHGEEIVGSRVKASLPHDHEFYEGVIETYDPIKNEHKAAYLDDSIAILRLENEYWLLHDEISAARHYQKHRTAKEYREEIVGSRVKVWWPSDNEFYEGVIETYDPIKKEHKVAYLDGDVEILRLENECWLLHVDISV